MQRTLSLCLVFLISAGTACGGDGGVAGRADGGPAGSGDPLDGVSNTDGGSPSSQDPVYIGGDPGPCGEEPLVQTVGWDETTEMGISAAEVFGPLAGTCQASLSWDGASFGPLDIEPRTGQSDLTVVVEVPEQSVRFVKPQPEKPGLPGCDPYLEAQAEVQLQTEDGAFDEAGEMDLLYLEYDGLWTSGFRRDAAELGGSLRVTVDEGERASLFFRLDSAGDSCAGEIDLQISLSTGEGTSAMGMTMGGAFATWSGTGCPLGSAPVNIDELKASGELSLAEVIDRVWGDVSYPGEWDDGQGTELGLQVEVEASDACAESSSTATMVVVPVSVTYGTADGRIDEHGAAAELQASFSPEGAMRGMDLWIDEELQCADQEDAIPYTLGACADLEGVWLQLGINHYGEYGSGTIESGEGLNAYENFRQGTASPGGADRVRVLALSPGQ